MLQRQLGTSGLTVSAMGLGCMGMSQSYGPGDDTESIRTLNRALDIGVTFFDTAAAYGMGANERLLSRVLTNRRTEVVLATKCGIVQSADGKGTTVDGSPAEITRSCDQSLERLGVDVIDLFYLHRVDPNVPIEETVGALAQLVKDGKVRALGLSEAGPETLRRASKVHPIAALQSEYSLWTRDVESNGVLATCRELGITFVPYSPLGRGFLTGAIQKIEDLDASDWRRSNYPRLAGNALESNLKLAEAIKALAAEKGISPAQLALAWVLAQGQDMVPIPGTKRVRYLEDNMGALDVRLTGGELTKISAKLAEFEIVGERYTPEMMALVQRA